MLEPRLTPERRRVGGDSFITWAQAIITQSVGVPVTAKRFGSIWRSRRGRVRVSECEAPDCSVSGATTHTSSLKARAIFSAAASPGAWMPSSFVTRMRMPPLISVHRKDSDCSSSDVVAKIFAIFWDQFVLPFPLCHFFSLFRHSIRRNSRQAIDRSPLCCWTSLPRHVRQRFRVLRCFGNIIVPRFFLFGAIPFFSARAHSRT